MSNRVGLIFDLDGTLIDSAPDIHATANLVFARNGYGPFDFATVRGFIGNGVGVLVARLMAHAGLPDAADLHDDLVSQFVTNYEQAVDLTTLYPGVDDALDNLAARGHPMAICTNKPASPARSVLRHFGLDRHFKVIIGGDSLPQRKPDPAPLLAAKVQLGSARILFVGDSEVDAETAVAANEPLVLYSQGYRKIAAELLGAKAIFDHFDALPGLVRHLEPRL
ncbi:phosphoglycolate phosphatase [Tabrizicola sp.]|uniref:phosphoglycolate phosphatase n=1 Tax=Tabrizicola sp. TaxID=2005166 RepID=UPI00286A981E|nr:phosphoglycolate phosphatase [Tabrizicola sp.]